MNTYDFEKDKIIYKDHVIENFFKDFPQQPEIKDYVKDNLIMLSVGGSHAYGLDRDSSDLDIRGIFKDNLRQILGDGKIEQIESSTNDVVIYSLTKVIKLIAENNPNVMELLWIDEEDILYATPEYFKLRERREAFLSKEAFYKFTGYANSQLHRIKGRDKWIIKEQSGKFDKKPNIKDYIIYVRNIDGNVSKIENIFGSVQFYFMKVKDEIYNVFWTGSKANFPLIENGNSFIPIQENHPFLAKHYYGVIWFNKSQFQKDLEEYNNWKKWKENRNPARHELEKKFDYDTKHGTHTFRLLLMGLEILTEKKVYVKRPDRDFLLSILSGRFKLDEIIEAADDLKLQLELEYQKSDLPEKIHQKEIVDIIMEFVNGDN